MHAGDVIVQLGPIRVYTVGAAIAAGFLVAAAASIPEGRRRGIGRHDLLELIVWLMLGVVVGARLATVGNELPAYAKSPLQLFRIPPDGLAFYGGLAAGVFLVALFAARRRLRFWSLLDTLAPGAALGYTCALALLSAGRAAGFELPWIGWVLVTGAYWVTAWTWRRRGQTRFEGELILAAIACDALARILLGSWAVDAAGTGGPSPRAAAVALGITAVLWFYLRGVSLRLPGRTAERPRPFSAVRWVAGYAVLVGAMLVGARAVG